MKENSNDIYLSYKELKIWSIYWFKRSWLSEAKFKNKGKYRPCVVLQKRGNQLILIPFSSTKTNNKWNIKYYSSTRKESSNIHIDRFKILDPKSISLDSENCKILNNVKLKDQVKNARITSKKVKREITDKYNKRLNIINLK